MKDKYKFTKKSLTNLLKIISKNLFISTIIYVILLILICILLYARGLMLRQWLIYTNFYIIALFSVLGLFQIFIKIKNDLIKFVLCFIYSLMLIVILPVAAFIPILFYYPEHVVVIDNQKMVAYVKSFQRVHVNYYKYKNIFVLSNKVKISEDYGEGGYDPFEKEESPKPNREYYN